MNRHIYPVVIALSLVFPLSGVHASTALVNNLVSDRDMTDANAMTLGQIQDFLMKKGTLASFFAADTDGVVRTASEIIWRVSKTYSISPKFLMALIQREQSLIEDPSPALKQYDWATGFGVCDSCAKDDPDVVVWKGFGKQVESAARQIRNRYLPDIDTKGVTVSGIGPGVGKTIDGTTVVPANKATAVLYTYTPHLHGNLNFANIWKRWFSLSYPDGTLVQADGSKDVWLISNGEKRKFASKAVFHSRFNDYEVLSVNQTDLDSYSEGAPIKFANYSIVSAPDGSNYLLDGDAKRHIASPDVFRKLGFNPEELEDATVDELAAYADGPEITVASSFPTGALLQDKKTGGVYWAQDGIKYPIWSKDVLNERFPKKTITGASAEQLVSLPTGDPVKFSDGTLVGAKGQAGVYVIEHGLRRPIPNEDIFNRIGWKWNNIIWTTEKVLALHPEGSPLDLGSATVESASQ